MTRLLILLSALVLLAAAGAGAAAGTFGTFLSDNHEAFRTYGLIFGATIGLLFAYWRARIATGQAEAAAKRADAAIDQVRIAEQGHITERFSRAVEQLGHDRVAVRIGGPYALKRIAEDSVERDHLAVMDVLTNFIRQPPYTKEQREAADREKAWRKFKPSPGEEYAEAGQIDRAKQTAPAAAMPPEPELIECPDIVAAIEISQGRSAKQKAIEEKRGYRLSLSRASLSYLRLLEVNLETFNFADADFSGASLTNANLTDADFTGTNLMHANLFGADLTRADLSRAILTDAILTRACIAGARLERASFWCAVLWTANLMRADLTGANLTEAKLTDADLTNADLTNAYLWDADVTGANLTGANLTGADLTGADLTNTKNLTQEQLDSACIRKGGKPPSLPEGLKPPQKVLSRRIR